MLLYSLVSREVHLTQVHVECGDFHSWRQTLGYHRETAVRGYAWQTQGYRHKWREKTAGRRANGETVKQLSARA